ncbi:hypothetical protein ACJX0J_002908 (mitochondrion) [Zea mays]
MLFHKQSNNNPYSEGLMIIEIPQYARNISRHIWLSKKFDKFLWEASSVAFLLPEIQQMTEYTNKKIKGDIHDYKNALPTLSGWSHFIDVSTISTEACLKSVRRWNGIWSAATRRTEGRVHEERSQALLHWFKSIFWLKLNIASDEPDLDLDDAAHLAGKKVLPAFLH